LCDWSLCIIVPHQICAHLSCAFSAQEVSPEWWYSFTRSYVALHPTWLKLIISQFLFQLIFWKLYIERLYSCAYLKSTLARLSKNLRCHFCYILQDYCTYYITYFTGVCGQFVFIFLVVLCWLKFINSNWYLDWRIHYSIIIYTYDVTQPLFVYNLVYSQPCFLLNMNLKCLLIEPFCEKFITFQMQCIYYSHCRFLNFKSAYFIYYMEKLEIRWRGLGLYAVICLVSWLHKLAACMQFCPSVRNTKWKKLCYLYLVALGL
jgi:hypothetical protein